MDNMDLARIDAFIDTLMALPHVRNETTLGAEYQIVAFVKSNMAQLLEAFRQPKYFPALDPREAVAAIFTRLGARTVAGAAPFFDSAIATTVDFNVVNKLRKDKAIDPEALKRRIGAFVRRMLEDPVTRMQYRSVSYILRGNVLDKYLRAVYERKGCVYNELVRMQRSPLSAEECASYLRILLLLKPYAFHKPDNRGVIAAFAGGEDKRRFADSCRQRLEGEFPELDQADLKLAMDANLPDFVLEKWEAAARFLYILSARYADYDPDQKAERGAESPDRSWYGVARPLCKGFGYDRGFLDELYMIATDLRI